MILSLHYIAILPNLLHGYEVKIITEVLKGAVYLIRISSFNRILMLSLLLSVFTAIPAANAYNGIRIADIILPDGASEGSVATSLVRGSEIWIPAELLRSLGVPLRGGPNGKNFLLEVRNPSSVFGIKVLERLAGKSIVLNFPSFEYEGTQYFNVTGMEVLTGLAAEDAFSAIKLKWTDIKHYPSGAKSGVDISNNKDIVLAWAHITKENPDLEQEGSMDALDIISPTWFNLSDGEGGMANRASYAYAEAARKKGWKVWALVSNGFSKVNTSQLFKDPGAVNLFIARILCYAKLYRLDGINIDFENVDVSDRDKYVRFISLLGGYLKQEGLVSSVDVHVPGNSSLSKSHDRAGLSRYVDYVMLMAYDEHWRTCPRAGSVASMPWVEQAVLKTLKEGVPPGKLVLGVPFYMRKWEETPSGQGKVKVKASTLTMAESDSIISEKSISPVWLNDKGQYFYSYISDGKTYKVWVENSDSIKTKLSLVQKYSLAGVAGWRKGHETPDVWQTVRSVMGR